MASPGLAAVLGAPAVLAVGQGSAFTKADLNPGCPKRGLQLPGFKSRASEKAEPCGYVQNMLLQKGVGKVVAPLPSSPGDR